MDERDQESFVVAVGGSAESPRPEECGRWRRGQHEISRRVYARTLPPCFRSRYAQVRPIKGHRRGAALRVNGDIRVSQMFTAWDERVAAAAEYRRGLQA